MYAPAIILGHQDIPEYLYAILFCFIRLAGYGNASRQRRVGEDGCVVLGHVRGQHQRMGVLQDRPRKVYGRQLMEQTDCSRLFCWFNGLSMADAIWAPSSLPGPVGA